ncbi:acetylornithine deacetylase [Oceanobacillus oncorhynchi subsp. incaldanensis]|uniref:M20 family metallopeptidase n=1 Tax=Oceanobacillus oncorhynchi TaxID=545501 RepID=UPI001B1E3B4E|nr:M20 family metallopeptidase [Oceanobacillus oncorhynchi]GIO20229.1 acetylornithine deacetylase [Oceanobacillus oncorhynchi subsp. incaldanensis]
MLNLTIEKLIDDYNEKEQIRIFKELVQIPSENPGNYEEGIAKKIQNILNNEGIKNKLVYINDKRPNVYAELEGSVEGKTLIYNGHIDTVPIGEGWEHNPFSAYEDEEGYIYGRGASDMKAGVSSMLYAAICLKKSGYPKEGKLILFFNIDEEISNLGMKQFLEEDISADYAIISEPTNLDIAIGHRGTARYNLKTRGIAGHSCYVAHPDNAIEKMNSLLPLLFDWGRRIKKEKINKFLGSALSNVTTIHGGTAGNIIPDECIVEIDRRLLPGETIEEVNEEYTKILTHEGEVDFELENYIFLPASLIEKDHHFVKFIYDTTKKYNEKVKIKSFEATCEAPFFSINKGIPTIIFGPGSLSQAHVVNERVHKSEVIKAGKLFIEICISLLNNKG